MRTQDNTSGASVRSPQRTCLEHRSPVHLQDVSYTTSREKQIKVPASSFRLMLNTFCTSVREFTGQHARQERIRTISGKREPPCSYSIFVEPSRPIAEQHLAGVLMGRLVPAGEQGLGARREEHAKTTN